MTVLRTDPVCGNGKQSPSRGGLHAYSVSGICRSYGFFARRPAQQRICSSRNSRSFSDKGSSKVMISSASAVVSEETLSKSLPMGMSSTFAMRSSVAMLGQTMPRSIRESDTVSISTFSAISGFFLRPCGLRRYFYQAVQRCCYS